MRILWNAPYKKKYNHRPYIPGKESERKYLLPGKTEKERRRKRKFIPESCCSMQKMQFKKECQYGTLDSKSLYRKH